MSTAGKDDSVKLFNRLHEAGAPVGEIIDRLRATGDELVSPAMLKLPAPISLRDALSHRLALGGPTAKIVALPRVGIRSSPSEGTPTRVGSAAVTAPRAVWPVTRCR